MSYCSIQNIAAACLVVCCADCTSAGWPPQRLPGTAATVGESQPHPAVARIIVPERDGTAFGSGTLIDSRDDYGLVLTNWHVVRDATGPIEVVFPGGFSSQARALKLDKDWDLAALVVWRPPTEPVALARGAPRPGDVLTIAGYGRGTYRQVSGRCTQYYSPRIDLPKELVELDVQARQGDSGGPIFNDRGELAGVLFGAGQGTTIGSFEGRVKTFLTSLAPDIGQRTDSAPQVAFAREPDVQSESARATGQLLAARPAQATQTAPNKTPEEPVRIRSDYTPEPITNIDWEVARNLLAVVGLVSLLVQFVKWAG